MLQKPFAAIILQGNVMAMACKTPVEMLLYAQKYSNCSLTHRRLPDVFDHDIRFAQSRSDAQREIRKHAREQPELSLWDWHTPAVGCFWVETRENEPGVKSSS